LTSFLETTNSTDHTNQVRIPRVHSYYWWYSWFKRVWVAAAGRAASLCLLCG
jgi:hypothetical protein